jgi:hypothetical protein
MTATTLTPTIRSATRRWLFWIAAGALLLVIAVVLLAARGASTGGVAFSATNAGPIGSKAVAEVLRQQGVTVAVPGTLAAAQSALRSAPAATLLLVDPDGHLDDAQLRSLASLATHLVLLTPTYAQAATLAPGIGLAGTVGAASLTGGCDLPAARAAGRVTGTGYGYRVVDGTAIGCFGSGKRVYSVVDLQNAGQRVTVVGTSAAFSNEHVAERGNAALALTLLGDHDRLVWYLPTIDDAAGTGTSIAQLTPGWVGSVATLAIIVAFTAAFWRGRRLGPLVVENLPVVVRASETMEGRARLYQKGAARLHALDSLRIGTVARLATRCGLPRLASVDEVIAAAAAVAGRDPADVRSVLIGAEPASDRELVRLSDDLLDLERAVASGIRPS